MNTLELTRTLRRLRLAAAFLLLPGFNALQASSFTAGAITFFQQPATTEKKGTETDSGTQGGTPATVVPPVRRGVAPRTGTGIPAMPTPQPRDPADESAQDPSQPFPGAQNAGQEGAVPAQGTSPIVPTQKRAKPQGGTMAFEFDAASIDTVISTVMGELDYSYIMDPSVTGQVSVFMRQGVPREALFPFLEQLLQMNGYAIIRKAEGFYAIVPLTQGPKIPNKVLLAPNILPSGKGKPAESAPSEPTPTTGQAPNPPPPPSPPPGVAARVEGTSAEPTPLTQQAATQQPPSSSSPFELGQSAQAAQLANEQGVITYVIPLNFIPSEQFLKMAQVYMSDGATVVDFAPSNMIMITDYRANIQQVLNLVDLLDTRFFDINTIDLVPIRYNKAADVAEDLGKVFAPDDQAGGVRLVAFERLNALLVVTHGQDVMKEVRGWIDRLDSPSSSSNVRTYIYQVENNTAENIATVLGELYSDGYGLPSSATPSSEERNGQQGESGSRPSRPQQEAGFAPQQNFPTSNSNANRGFRGSLDPQGNNRALGPSLSGRPDASTGIRAAVSTGNVKIIVNEFNNSLIIQATEADYQYLLETIEQLDILPRQVIIEAEIYRVTLNDNLSFGVSYFLEDRAAEGPARPTTGSIGDARAGQFTASTLRIVGDHRRFRSVINALRSQTYVEVVDSPRILTVDGVQANINVGADVPVTTASFGDPLQSGSSINFVNSITFRPTGTTLLIIPRVSASGIVTLELSIEVSSSSSSGADETNLTPTINRSAIETTMICQDGQTVALGGIISDSYDKARDRVPILGDIPVIGALFGNTIKTKARSELIFLITPKVIHRLPTAAELTLEFKQALKNAYEYIQDTQSARQELIQKRKNEKEKKP